MSDLTHKVEDDLMDMFVLGRDYATDAELKDFGDSIINIGRRTSALYKDLCARKVFTSNTNKDCWRLTDAKRDAQESMEFRRLRAVLITRKRETKKDPGQVQVPDKHQH